MNYKHAAAALLCGFTTSSFAANQGVGAIDLSKAPGGKYDLVLLYTDSRSQAALPGRASLQDCFDFAQTFTKARESTYKEQHLCVSSEKPTYSVSINCVSTGISSNGQACIISRIRDVAPTNLIRKP